MFESLNDIEGFPLRRSSQFGIRQNPLKGPSRVIRLCLLGVLLPALLIAVPLYLRYRVYNSQLYPVAISDMRIVDGKISTLWCQRQIVSANTTFNAYLVSGPPKISEKTEPLTMTRHLLLEDDMKEYWGFYLLKGSVVRVSTCVRWPGASLIMIRGHKHLHECAYIGDNSSEEFEKDIADGPANKPNEMRRHRPDVQFLQPPPSSHNKVINQPPEPAEEIDETDIKRILDTLQNKTKNVKEYNRNVDKNPKQNTVDLTLSEEIINDIMKTMKKFNVERSEIITKLNKKLDIDEERRKREIFLTGSDLNKAANEEENVAREEEVNESDDKLENSHMMSNSEFWSSFSSSEEALLSCSGLILNLPLTPHHKCSANLTKEEAEETFMMNTITYKVPINGYYFFLLNSENEVQQNYLRVEFDLDKTVYDVSESLAFCSNISSDCALSLDFLSDQKVVLHLPLQNKSRNTHFNEEFVAETRCEPRSTLYALCVVTVPVVFIIFAFT